MPPQTGASIFGIDPRLMTTSPDVAMKAVNGVLGPINNAVNPFAAFTPGFNERKPLPGETPLAYRLRMNRLDGAVALENFAGNVGSELGKLGNYVFGSEQGEQQKRAKAAAAPAATNAPSVFPQSFADPKWDALEKQYGGDVAPLLKQIRMQGERTNYGPQGDPRYQNPRTGAYTPYQITSATRDLFRNGPGYKFDPWATPENAVKAAAQVLRDHGGAKNPTAAVAGYFGGGAAARNPFSTSMGDGNLSVNQYVNRVLFGSGGQGGQPGTPGALVNPFDPSYYNAAVGQLDRAQQAAMTPTKSVFAGEPMPELPKPEPMPKRDWTQADAALEALRPVEITEREQKDIQWKNFWNGLGRAMASSPNGEGLGSLLLRIGGGALMGKGAAGDEIQQRKDAYDQKLARFNAAIYEHDMAKAQATHNELVADWQANQSWIQNKYQQALGIWQSNTKVQLVGNQLINQHIDSKTGNITVTTTPVSSLVQADDARDRANLAMQAFGVENSANSQVAGIANRIQGQVVMGQAAQVLADQNSTQGERAAAAAFGPLPAIKYVVDKGMLASVLGPDEVESMNEDIITTLSGQGFMPGSKEYQNAYREAAIGRMLVAVQDPATFQRLMQGFGSAAELYSSYDQFENAKTTARTQTKAGNTTYTRTIEEE